jgi:hypothetical protein
MSFDDSFSIIQRAATLKWVRAGICSYVIPIGNQIRSAYEDLSAYTLSRTR